MIVAHRGLLRHAPENTISNFRACLELRLGFELDVEKSKDGNLVCIHDDTVDRTTDGTGKVSDLPLKELRKLDAGGWFDSRFAGEKVPTLNEVFSLIAQYHDRNVLIAVDLKAAGVEEEVVRMAQEQNILNRLLFIGKTISEPQVRDRIRKVSRHAQTAAVANNPAEFSETLAWTNADWVYFRYLPPAEQMAAVRTAGKKAFIAGASVSGNVPENWRQAVEVNIDGILTDYPFELAAILRKEQ
jgi:glycerophosphoryl diester phosphodiesterase